MVFCTRAGINPKDAIGWTVCFDLVDSSSRVSLLWPRDSQFKEAIISVLGRHLPPPRHLCTLKRTSSPAPWLCLLENYPLHWLISVGVILTVELINLKTCHPVLHLIFPMVLHSQQLAFKSLVSVSSKGPSIPSDDFRWSRLKATRTTWLFSRRFRHK